MDDISVSAAEHEDAASVARVYAPYVRDTVVTFEVEPPDAPTMARRMVDTLSMYPWLVAENAAGEILGYAYAGRHRERPAYRWTIDTTVYIDRGDEALSIAPRDLALSGLSLGIRGNRPAQCRQRRASRTDGIWQDRRPS